MSSLGKRVQIQNALKMRTSKKRNEVPTRDPLTAMREEAVLSLSDALIQAWKARFLYGESNGAPSGCAYDPTRRLEQPANEGGHLINTVIERLDGKCDNALITQNRLVYSDKRLGAYLGTLYSRGTNINDVVPKFVKYSLDTTDRIVSLCRVIGYTGMFVPEWYLQTDRHYLLLFLTRSWGANLKFNSQYLFSFYEGLELPIAPDCLVGRPGDLCRGRPGQSIRRRCMGTNLQAIETRFTLLQGFKKSLLPLEEEDWRATMEDTHKSLTSEPPEMSDRVHDEMIRTGNELAARTPGLKVKQNYKISKSACINRQRCFGGFASYYFDHMHMRGFRVDEPINGFKGPQGIPYRINPPYLVGSYREKGNWEEKLAYSRCPFTYLDMYDEFLPIAKNGCRQERNFDFGQWDVNPNGVVKVRAIPEPFKFRVISIGDFNDYSVLKPYQVQLWKTLQQFECFSLTGSGADDLMQKTQAIIAKYWDVGKKFLSGDYKNATNFLSSLASRTILGQWMKHDPEFLMMMERSLFGCELNFEDAGKGVEGLVPGTNPAISFEGPSIMRNGQLMGHPCSFPILCAVNAAICRMVLEEVWGRKFTLDDLPLLINGDDCLLIGPNSLLPVWRERTREVGLYESVGKSYFTDQFAMINSRYLKVDTVRIPIEADGYNVYKYQAYVSEDVGYVNLGILAGRKKGASVDCEVGIEDKVSEKSCYLLWQSASANYAQMNLRCKRLRVGLYQYLETYKKFFTESKSPIKNIPLFLPTNQGGFGFAIEDGMGRDEEVPDWIDLDLVGDQPLYPRSFSTVKKNPAVMLGEAYYCGAMASVYDDEDWYGFDELSQEIYDWYRTRIVMSRAPEGDPFGMMRGCAPEPPKQSEWIVTVCGSSRRGGESSKGTAGRLVSLRDIALEDNCVNRAEGELQEESSGVRLSNCYPSAFDLTKHTMEMMEKVRIQEQVRLALYGGFYVQDYSKWAAPLSTVGCGQVTYRNEYMD